MHENDRRQKAKQLGLTLEEFDRLLTSANRAYETIKNLGPFYGKENIKEPTFRITAQPVILPQTFKKKILQFGEDAMILGKALPKLPEIYKEKLGSGLDFTVPPTWRFDAIWDEQGELKVNELEGVDGASALLIAEQMAFNISTVEDSSAAKLTATYQKEYFKKAKVRLALLLRTNYPHKMNSVQFIQLLKKLSKGGVRVDIFEEYEIREKKKTPKWNAYDGIINESTYFLEELLALGIKKEKMIAAGNYNAVINKGVFALVFDKNLKTFWNKELGASRLARIQDMVIYSTFIETEKDLEKAKKEGKVIKVCWTPTERVIINRAIGVMMPEGDEKHSDTTRWEGIKKYLRQGSKIIAQEYVRPKRIKAYLRKKGTGLEPVQWYNRICAKYVCMSNPNKSHTCDVAMTGVEVTLGPDIVPAGRACAFTAGYFEEEEVITRPHMDTSSRHFLQIPEE